VSTDVRWRRYDQDRPGLCDDASDRRGEAHRVLETHRVSGGGDGAESDAGLGEEPFVIRLRFAELAVQVPTRHRSPAMTEASARSAVLSI
jgi:hypothetical protein